MRREGTSWHPGRQAAGLMLAAGAFTIVNNYLPDAGHLDKLTLNGIGALAMVLGAIGWVIPWERLPTYSTLVMVPLALGLISFANRFGGVGPYSYAVYFVVLFVWIGLAYPPGFSLLLAVPTAVAYVLPSVGRGDELPVGSISSIYVALPVCVLVAETIARVSRRQRYAQLDAQSRADLGARLVEVVADVNSVLAADEVLPRICDGVRRLVGAEGAAFVTAEDGMARVASVAGLPEDMVGVTYEISEGSIGDVIATRAPVIIHKLDLYPVMMDDLRAAVPGLHELVAVPSLSGTEVDGALYACVGDARGDLTQPELDALQVLAGHIGAALRNADTFAEVVRQRVHEQAVIDGMGDGMAVLDTARVVLSWNAAAERLTGISAAEAVGRLIPLPVSLHEPAAHRLGDGRWLEIVGSPLPPHELVVCFRDVSKAKALDEAKDLFLATTSHELRTPLTVIKGFTATLQQRWDKLPDELRAEALKVVADRTDSLISLVDHLLLSAKAGASRHSLDCRPVVLMPVLEEAAHQVKGLSPRHLARIDVAADLPPVLADITAFDQVLGQLVENAVKYSPQGGPVDLTARLAADRVVVGVADRGIGLKPGTEETVFERFVQGQDGDRREYGGVGLGLHIVRTLVEAMGGEVRARNRQGGGSMFEFTLPITQPNMSSPSPGEVMPVVEAVEV